MLEAIRLGGWEAGRLEVKPFISFLSLLAFQPPSLQLIVSFADGRMLIFQHPADSASTPTEGLWTPENRVAPKFVH
jgi:hypothetical protein